MDELDRLLERAADRGAPRGSDRVWAGAAATVERARASVASGPAEHRETLLAEGPTATIAARRAVRLLAVAATIALLVAGAAVRWSALRSSTSGPSVSVGDSSGPPPSTIGTSAGPTTSTTAASPVPPAAVTALSQAPHYLPGNLPDGYRLWDIAPSPLSDGRVSLSLDVARPGDALGHTSVLVEPTAETAIEVLTSEVAVDLEDVRPCTNASPTFSGCSSSPPLGSR